MKRILLFSAIIFSLVASVNAQSSSSISFQAIVRDAENTLIRNKQVSMRISLLNGLEADGELYIETHSILSNQNGLVTLKIGEGITELGSFKMIDWSTGGPFFIKTETDPNGGSDYVLSGTSQLLSVPFALHSNTANDANKAKYALSSNWANISDYSNFSGQAESAKTAEVAEEAEYAELAGGLIGGFPEQKVETSLYPQSGAAGRFLTVSFSGGTGVRFSGGSQTVALQYGQASSTYYQGSSTHQQASQIYPERVFPINDKKVDALFRLPHNAASGLYDVIISPNTSDRKVLSKSFHVYWY